MTMHNGWRNGMADFGGAAHMNDSVKCSRAQHTWLMLAMEDWIDSGYSSTDSLSTYAYLMANCVPGSPWFSSR